jgi:hypothetical protein
MVKGRHRKICVEGTSGRICAGLRGDRHAERLSANAERVGKRKRADGANVRLKDQVRRECGFKLCTSESCGQPWRLAGHHLHEV